MASFPRRNEDSGVAVRKLGAKLKMLSSGRFFERVHCISVAFAVVVRGFDIFSKVRGKVISILFELARREITVSGVSSPAAGSVGLVLNRRCPKKIGELACGHIELGRRGRRPETDWLHWTSDASSAGWPVGVECEKRCSSIGAVLKRPRHPISARQHHRKDLAVPQVVRRVGK